jgi:acyl carrier protein
MNLAPSLANYLTERESVLAQVRDILISSVDLGRSPDEIDPDTALFGTGLGLDSLDAVELVIVLANLGIKLEGHAERVLALRSVNAIVDLIMRSKGLLP